MLVADHVGSGTRVALKDEVQVTLQLASQFIEVRELEVFTLLEKCTTLYATLLNDIP